MNEKREFLRVPLQFNIEVDGGEAGRMKGETRDLSLRGVCISCDTELEEGEVCDLRLQLGDGENAVSLDIIGRVVRNLDGGIAVEFQGLKGVDALEHLRKLVLYNAENSQEAEAEIRAHKGIERKTDQDD